MGTLTDPSANGYAVTPSDSANILGNTRTRGIYVGTGGNMSVQMDNGTVVFTAVVGGSLLPIRVTRVNSTGTTASNIVALF